MNCPLCYVGDITQDMIDDYNIKIILEFLKEWEKEIGFPFSQKEMHIRDGIWVKKKHLEEGDNGKL